MNDTLLTHLVEDFLIHLEVERNVSRLTVRNYRHYLERFVSWLTHFSSTPPAPSSIDQNAIRRFRLYLARLTDQRGKELEKSTQNYHLIALRSFLKYLSKRDIDSLSAEKIDLSKSDAKSLKFLSHEQIERLLGQPKVSDVSGLRDKAILETLFSTGLRVSELTALNVDQINYETREIGVIGKGRRPRVVFLSERCLEWIRKYCAMRSDDYKPLFIRFGGTMMSSDRNGEDFRLSVRGIQRIIEKYVQMAKIPLKITPHGIRHTFATDLLSAGADLRAIQEMLGHKNVATTQIYTHVTNPQLKKIHAQFHSKST